MKKLVFFLLIGILGCNLLNAQGTKPFKGVIKYQIAYKSEQIPQEQLAQQPTEATIKVSDTKLLMNSQATKIIFNADDKKAYTLMNLSQLGLGKYVITSTEADLTSTDEMMDYTINLSDETKEIKGYTAHKASGSYTTPAASFSFTAWYVKDFCDPFLTHIDNSFAKLPGFPLEYAIDITYTQNGVSLSSEFTVNSISSEEVDPKEFNVPKSYQKTTEEELEKIFEEFQEAMQMD